MSYQRSEYTWVGLLMPRDTITRPPDIAQNGAEILPSVYSVGSLKNLVTVRSRDTYFNRRKNGSMILVILSSVIATLLIAVVVLAVLYSRLYQAHDICSNEHCLRIAASLKQSMDTSVDPCDDFFGYVCGRWAEGHHSLEIRNSWFHERAESNSLRVIESLEKNLTEEEVPWAVVQAKKLYGSCMDIETIDLLGTKPLLRILKKVDLPHTPAVLTGKYGNIVEIMAKIRRVIGDDIFFGVYVFRDPRNKSSMILHGPNTYYPISGLNAEMERRLKAVRSRNKKSDPEEDTNSRMTPEKTFMFKVMREIVSNGTVSNCSFKDESSDSRDRVIKKAVDVIDDQIRTIQYMVESGVSEGVADLAHNNLDYMLVEQLQEETDRHVKEVNSSLVPREIWRPYMEELFRDVTDFDFSKDVIYIGNMQFLKDVAHLLAATEETVLETTIWWIIVRPTTLYLSTNFKIIAEEYLRDTIAYDPSTPRSLYCAGISTWAMGMAVSWLVVDPDFHSEKGTKVIEMFEDIRSAFSTIVVDADWVDQQMQHVTLEKAQKMTYGFGYPHWLFADGMLDDYYEGIDMKEDEYLDNVMAATRFMKAQSLNYLTRHHRSNDPGRQYSCTKIGNEKFIRTLDAAIPAGMIQFPFYELGLEALNYGALGSVMGHEFTHGFDSIGMLHDKNGNIRQLWNETTIYEYKEKIQCFVKHYSGYYVPEVDDYINGKVTLDENIADNGGLHEAVLAYKKWKSKHGQEPMLPGFTHLTHEQLLFLGFAHMWCDQNTADSLRWRIKGYHPPNYVRVKGVLENSPEFSEAWKCPLGSEMNPVKKCKVW